jgi:hypothetical protein
MSTAAHAHGAQINFGDLTPYLIYVYGTPIAANLSLQLIYRKKKD